MGSLSNFLENALLNHICNTAFTPAATIYVALCTADPGEAGTAVTNEIPVANGYARQPVTFGAAASRRVVQSGAVTFPQATGAGWPQVTHWALVSTAAGAGDLYAYGNFTTPFTPVAGNTPTIPTAELEVEIVRSHYTATTISATATPNALNDSANNFPLWPAGTILYVSGFTGTPANNGIVTVVSSTPSQIVVTGVTFVNDAAGESVRIAQSGGFTDYTVHNWLNRAFRNQAFAKPNTFVGLSTAVVEDDDVAFANLTEVSGGTYGRVQVNPNGGAAPTWTVATTGALDNVQAITFPIPTASWGPVTSMFLIDSGPAAGTAGNVLAYDNESIATQTPVSGDTVQFAIGALDLTLS